MKNIKPTLYKVKSSTRTNNVPQTRIYTSLTAAIMQVKADYENNVIEYVDQLVSVTYTDHNKQEQSALIAVLQQLKISAVGGFKDQISFKLDYLKGGC